MKRKYSKYCVVMGLFCAIVGFSIFALNLGSFAGKTPQLKFGGTTPAAPASSPVPDEIYSPKMATLKIEESLTYEIAVPEEKIRKHQLEPEDLELITGEKDQFNFFQVECFYYRTVIQKQTKSSSAITCWRTREGIEYWLTDKTKFVEWGPWTGWISR